MSRVLDALEQKGISKVQLLSGADKAIAEAKKTMPILSKEEIHKSKHPLHKCKLCGQRGTDKKYAGYYFHNKCFRILKKYGEDIQGKSDK